MNDRPVSERLASHAKYWTSLSEFGHSVENERELLKIEALSVITRAAEMYLADMEARLRALR